MLLDCASILQYMKFDNYGSPNTGAQKANEWAFSDIRTWLNGTFLTDRFTTVEASAIAESTKAGKGQGDGAGWSGYLGYAPLNKDQVFLLDAVEATNTTYGFENKDTDSNTRIKKLNNSNDWWWLRSPDSHNNGNAGFVGDRGTLTRDHVYYNGVGVSPALNINLSSVIFSSLISGTAGEAGAEYKLTLLDSDMEIGVGSAGVSQSGNTITVPYSISGDHKNNANQVSVLIMDSAYSAGTAATSGFSYLKLDVGSFGTTGTGTFTLPAAYADKTCGTDYYAYILAEDINNGNATDYASAPASITIPAAHTHSWTYSASGATITATCNSVGTCDITSGKTITISAPAAPLTYNGQPKAATLSTGYDTTAFPGTYTIRYQGTGSTTYDSTTAPSAVGTYQAGFTAGTATASVEYEITKAAQAAPAAPMAESVTENSVTLKKTAGYQYSMDGTDWQDSNVFSGLTKDTEYTFYQRVAGDANHEPSPASPGTAITTGSIIYTVTGTEGTAHTVGSGEDAVYTVKRNVNDASETFQNYTGVTVDGKAVPDGCSTARSGSLILTLKSSYLDTLSAGDHKVTISFADGTAGSSLTIRAAEPKPVPITGDRNHPGLWIGLILLDMAGLAAGGRKVFRKEK